MVMVWFRNWAVFHWNEERIQKEVGDAPTASTAAFDLKVTEPYVISTIDTVIVK